MDSPSLDMSYKWNPTVYGCAWLLSLNIMLWWLIHVIACIRIIFHCMDIPHFNVYPFIFHEHFVSPFWLLYSMLLWTFTYRFLNEWMFLILGYIWEWNSSFWGITRLFSKVAVPFYIPSISVWRFQFLYVFAKISFLFLVIIESYL